MWSLKWRWVEMCGVCGCDMSEDEIGHGHGHGHGHVYGELGQLAFGIGKAGRAK